jgi:hypothetical protein
MQAASELVKVPPVWTARREKDLMSNQGHGPCATGDPEVRSMFSHEWHVSDRRCHERSPEKVLGYIEKRGSAFDPLADSFGSGGEALTCSGCGVQMKQERVDSSYSWHHTQLLIRNATVIT